MNTNANWPTNKMIQAEKLEEIKKLQKLSAERMDLQIKVQDNEERSCISLSTRYWTWHPFHYSECPDADTGDLFLTQEDLQSDLVEEMIKAFNLLSEVKFYVSKYKLKTVKDLRFLVCNENIVF